MTQHERDELKAKYGAGTVHVSPHTRAANGEVLTPTDYNGWRVSERCEYCGLYGEKARPWICLDCAAMVDAEIATAVAPLRDALPSLLADSERAEALEGMLRKLVGFIEKHGPVTECAPFGNYYGYARLPVAFTALLTEAAAVLGEQTEEA